MVYVIANSGGKIYGPYAPCSRQNDSGSASRRYKIVKESLMTLAQRYAVNIENHCEMAEKVCP